MKIIIPEDKWRHRTIIFCAAVICLMYIFRCIFDKGFFIYSIIFFIICWPVYLFLSHINARRKEKKFSKLDEKEKARENLKCMYKQDLLIMIMGMFSISFFIIALLFAAIKVEKKITLKTAGYLLFLIVLFLFSLFGAKKAKEDLRYLKDRIFL